ncbi:MAG: hypothetical protein DIU72_000065 [Pseudomonadota bacterium]
MSAKVGNRTKKNIDSRSKEKRRALRRQRQRRKIGLRRGLRNR